MPGMSTQAQRHEALCAHLKEDQRKVGVVMEPYDPDFLVASIMRWMHEHNCVLIGDGIRRIKQR